MNRRLFLGVLGAVGAGGTLSVLNGKINANQGQTNTVNIEKLELSDEEWKQRLTPEQYKVLRKEGTERPYTSPLNREYGEGTYVCAGCELPLFTSETKYDSGTGWPSFWASIEGHTQTKTDFKLIFPRTEYHCARCGGHQGHVFDDGHGKVWMSSINKAIM